MSHSSSADLRVEFKEVHAAAPTGSWARLAHMLTSLSELYIIFERVCCLIICSENRADSICVGTALGAAGNSGG